MSRTTVAQLACAIASTVLPAWAQVEPLPIPGGDLIPPFIHQFAPGPLNFGLDGNNAEPNGITNFRGSFALAYLVGTATDASGATYDISADIRIYQGDYLGATGLNNGAGPSRSAGARGTFVEI